MKHMKILISAAIVLACTQIALQADTLVPKSQINMFAEVQSVERDGDTIRAIIRNNSSKRLASLTLLVQFNWLWKDDYNPGPDSPGWSEYVTLANDVEPGVSFPFEYTPKRPLPARSDGHFMPRLSVVAVTPYK